MSVDGNWYLPYSLEDGDGPDADHSAGGVVLTLNGGRINGSDPEGRVYDGGYETGPGGALRAEISVTAGREGAVPPYEQYGVRFPVLVAIEGEYRGGAEMPFRGTINGKLPIRGTAQRTAGSG